MTTSASNIRAAIRELWPRIALLWLPDGTYERPAIADVIAALQASGVATIEKRGELWDCDDYALAANYQIKRHCLANGVENPWAFGECFCSKLKGREVNHTLNILHAQNGLWLIEPQGYHHWLASKERDNVETVKM